jgi:hypothetical protein
MRFDDRIIGIAFAALSLVVIALATQFPSVPGTTFGPDLFPTLIGVAMFGMAARIFVDGLRAPARRCWIDVRVWHGRTRGLVAAAWVIVGIVVGIAFFDQIGFPLFGFLYALPLMLFMRARPITATIVCLVAVLLSYFVFSRLLYVPLPVGPLWFLG